MPLPALFSVYLKRDDPNYGHVILFHLRFCFHEVSIPICFSKKVSSQLRPRHWRGSPTCILIPCGGNDATDRAMGKGDSGGKGRADNVAFANYLTSSISPI